VHAAEQKQPNVFMWSARGPGSTVYLLGSMHVFRESSYPLDTRIEKAYQSCPRTAFEADMRGTNTDEIRDMMLRLGTYPEGKTLKTEISQRTYNLLKQRALSDSIQMEQLDKHRPWFVAITIASAELRRLGFTGENGLDAHFYTKASKDRKKMVFLETARQQLELLAESFPGREEDLLRQALEEMKVLDKESAGIEQAWKTGDAAGMEAFTKKSLKGFPEVEKKLFTERNAAWTDRIAKLLTEKGDVFMVVGAAHLVGEKGVVEMLRARGFTVVQQ